jgi:hypothetical protein
MHKRALRPWCVRNLGEWGGLPGQEPKRAYHGQTKLSVFCQLRVSATALSSRRVQARGASTRASARRKPSRSSSRYLGASAGRVSAADSHFRAMNVPGIDVIGCIWVHLGADWKWPFT